MTKNFQIFQEFPTSQLEDISSNNLRFLAIILEPETPESQSNPLKTRIIAEFPTTARVKKLLLALTSSA